MIAAASGFTVAAHEGRRDGPGLRRRAPRPDGGDRRSARGGLPAAGDRDVTEPDPELAEIFARQRERFKALYGAVKPEFRR